MQARQVIIPLLLSALPAAARADVQGSGRVVDQNRQVAEFSRVQVASGIQARIEPGPRSLSLRGDDNLLALVRTEVKNGTLLIGFEPHSSVHMEKPVVASIRAPRLDGLGASGGSEIDSSVPTGDELRLEASGGSHIRVAKGLTPRRLEIQASGGSQVDVSGAEASAMKVHGSGGAVLQLAGRATDAELHFSGGTVVKAGALTVETLEVHGSGGGEASLRANKAVRGALSGGTSLRIGQTGATVEVTTSGGAEVIRR
jgi:hypothetical protein